jgi:hypothetical protein
MYKYRAIGPRGGEYLTTTLQEAKYVTRNGGQIFPLEAIQNPSDTRLLGVLKAQGPLVAWFLGTILYTPFRDRYHVSYSPFAGTTEAADNMLLSYGKARGEATVSNRIRLTNLIKAWIKQKEWKGTSEYPMDTSHKVDFGRNKAIPWILKQIKKAIKAAEEDTWGDNEAYTWIELAAIHQYKDSIFNWVAQEKPKNLMSLKVVEVLKEAEEYEGIVPPANIVLKLEGGWTLQELLTEDELRCEGDAQGTCVGGYFDEVDAGEKKIFSLRDSKNRPRVTFEISDTGAVAQVLGQGNNMISDPTTCAKIIKIILKMGWHMGPHYSRGVSNLKRCLTPKAIHKAVGVSVEGDSHIQIEGLAEEGPFVLVYTDGKPHMILKMKRLRSGELTFVDTVIDIGTPYDDKLVRRKRGVLERVGIVALPWQEGEDDEYNIQEDPDWDE